MTTALAVGLLAGVGALARYAADRRVPRPGGFPVGILLVNVSGSLLFGLVTGWHQAHVVSAGAVAVLGAGFAGGYTTLSTWAWDTEELRANGRWRLALLNLVATTVLCVGAAAAGVAAAA